MIYQIPTNLYSGCGTAVAAVKDNQVVALRYVDREWSEPSLADIGYKRMAGNAVRKLRQLRAQRRREARQRIVAQLAGVGQVFAGMASGGEFVAE